MATRNTFSFVGKIAPIKDTDKFKGYVEQDYSSGWRTEKLRFNVVAGDNRHLVEINAGCWKKEEKNDVIRTFSRAADGKKSEKITIPYAKRNDPKEIEKVAGYLVYTCDTDTYQHRKALEDEGKDDELEASKKKRKHFLVGTDFVQWVKKVVYSDKIKDMTFRINGNIVYSYSEKTGRYYSQYEVTKIYRVENDVEPTSNLNIHFYYTEDFMNKESVEDSGKAILNGYTQFYDSQTKANWFAPIAVVMRESDLDVVETTEEVLNEFTDSEVCYAMLSCQAINGAQKQDITIEDLPEKVQKAIKAGIMSEEQAIRNAGGQIYGDRIQEIRFDEIGKMSEATVYEADALVEKPHVKKEENEADVETDIFGDDDDDI